MAKSTPSSYDPADEPEATPASSAPKKTAAKPAPAVAEPVVAPAAVRSPYPGQTLGIVAVVFALFMQVPALAMGIIAWVWSHKAGVRNVPAIIAVSVSGALIIIGTALFAAWIALVGSIFGGLAGLDDNRPFPRGGGAVQIMPGDDMMRGDDFEQHLNDMLEELEEGGMENMPGPGMMNN